uniref:Uncharacterized protein n=1 Tax=Laticauda laticaudata TaxID=8630 RepID=A0A8C5SFP1_LATLA
KNVAYDWSPQLYDHHSIPTHMVKIWMFENWHILVMVIYTVNLESRYLLIQEDYPSEEFTKVYLIKFLKIQSAKKATKRKLDEQNFFGSLLYICYAPEFERNQRQTKIYSKSNQLQRFVKQKTQLGNKLKICGLNLAHGVPPACSACQQKWSSGGPSSIYSCDCLLKSSAKTYYISFRKAFPESLSSTHYSHHCATKSACFCQNIRMDKKQQQRVHNTLACWNVEKKDPCDEDLGRLIRGEDNKFALLGREPNTEETIFGPRLQKIPKIDMDNSMNITAILILNRLKKVVEEEFWELKSTSLKTFALHHMLSDTMYINRLVPIY